MIIKLWEIRQKNNLTLKQLSALSGISKSEINAIENGQVSPRFDTLECLDSSLKCKIGDIVESEYL